MSSATPRADARLAGKLWRAVQMNEFIVHYQPIVDLTSAGVVGVEALVRWRRNDGTLVPAAEFIPIAEDMGLIVPIARIVLFEAMRQTLVWQRSSPKIHDLRLHVNISGRHLREPDVVADVMDALEATGYDAAQLTVELTETALMSGAPTVSEHLEKLRALGIRILDLETVAEGIEEPSQVEELLRLGCELGQGYHFARPLSARAMTAYLRSTRSGTPAVAGATAALAG